MRKLVKIIKKIFDYREWDYELDNNELYFILSNREVFTKNMNDEELIELLNEIVCW